MFLDGLPFNSSLFGEARKIETDQRIEEGQLLSLFATLQAEDLIRSCLLSAVFPQMYGEIC